MISDQKNYYHYYVTFTLKLGRWVGHLLSRMVFVKWGSKRCHRIAMYTFLITRVDHIFHETEGDRSHFWNTFIYNNAYTLSVIIFSI